MKLWSSSQEIKENFHFQLFSILFFAPSFSEPVCSDFLRAIPTLAMFVNHVEFIVVWGEESYIISEKEKAETPCVTKFMRGTAPLCNWM